MDDNGKRRRKNPDRAISKSAEAGRSLRQRVKTAKGRKLSSKLWLERQLNDPYVAAARQAGFRSRAAFKLAEIDDRCGLFRRGRKVVDLGAAPGGWTQVAVDRVQSRLETPAVVAVDLLDMEPIPGALQLKLDFLDEQAPDQVRLVLAGAVDVVMSDMASPSTGHRSTDHLRVVALCDAAYDFAVQVLTPGGAFLAKVFQGGTEHGLLVRMKADFETVHHVKPKASRDESPEMYVLALGFRGQADNGRRS